MFEDWTTHEIMDLLNSYRRENTRQDIAYYLALEELEKRSELLAMPYKKEG